MRVCFVLPSLNGGGAERAAVTVVNALDSTVFDRELYLFRREGPYLAEVRGDVRLTTATRDDRVSRVWTLARHVRRTAPDIVVAFLSYFTVFAAVRLAGRGTRFVINQQTPVTAFLSDADYQWRRPMWRNAFDVIARRVYPAADGVVATSAGVKADLVGRFGVDSSRVAVVHNPIDLDRIRARAAEPIADPRFTDGTWPRIVAAGRLAEAKNYPLLIKAIALLRDQGINVTVAILGTGDLESMIRTQIRASGVDDRIHLLGFQENPWKFVSRADAFVLTSHYEGFGNVLIEAMACGTPVVATDSPGTREIIRSDHNGLLVERHEPEAVASALRRVLTDRSMAARFRADAAASVKAYAVPAVVREYSQLFTRLARTSLVEAHA